MYQQQTLKFMKQMSRDTSADETEFLETTFILEFLHKIRLKYKESRLLSKELTRRKERFLVISLFNMGWLTKGRIVNGVHYQRARQYSEYYTISIFNVWAAPRHHDAQPKVTHRISKYVTPIVQEALIIDIFCPKPVNCILAG